MVLRKIILKVDLIQIGTNCSLKCVCISISVLEEIKLTQIGINPTEFSLGFLYWLNRLSILGLGKG